MTLPVRYLSAVMFALVFGEPDGPGRGGRSAGVCQP